MANKVVWLAQFKRNRLIHGQNRRYCGEMNGARSHARKPKVSATASKRKERHLMIRVDDAQKARIQAAADREEQKTANWARKLADGWQLVPPDWKVLPPERQ
jgi:tRNA(Ile2) C34 agmatinyltransferase TiaS